MKIYWTQDLPKNLSEFGFKVLALLPPLPPHLFFDWLDFGPTHRWVIFEKVVQ